MLQILNLMNEMPILKTLLDRADQVYGLRDSPSEQEIREYTRQKTRLRKRKPHNYNFLKKLMTYAKSIKPVIIKTEDSDPCDLTGQQTIFENSEGSQNADENENMHGDESGSHRSHRSHEHEYSCNYCSFQTHNETDYNRHVVIKHPGKPGYNERNGRTYLMGNYRLRTAARDNANKLLRSGEFSPRMIAYALNMPLEEVLEE